MKKSNSEQPRFYFGKSMLVMEPDVDMVSLREFHRIRREDPKYLEHVLGGGVIRDVLRGEEVIRAWEAEHGPDEYPAD